MGKSKDSNKLKRSSPSSSRDEAKTKRRKIKEDDEKHKSKKKHKSSEHHSRRDEKSGGKRKDKSRKHDSKIKIQELSNDDYFSKNNEFAMWLKEERKVFFSDLSSDSSRSLFSEFVAEWNNRQLKSQYYEGIATGPRTSHKWNIKQ